MLLFIALSNWAIGQQTELKKVVWALRQWENPNLGLTDTTS